MNLVISIIGFGNVGKTIGALLIPLKGQSFTMNIIDSDWRVAGAILDMKHGAELHQNCTIVHNSLSLLEESDFIFHCAGASVPKGKSRLFIGQASVEITASIFKGFKSKKSPFIIVVANPVEIITLITQRLTKLPKSKVIGVGTSLDSLRMDFLVKQTNDAISSIESVLLGEHGTSAFLSEQLSTVNGRPFSEYFDKDTIEGLMTMVKSYAEQIKETQKATIYGVSYCAIHLFESLLSEKDRFIPVSTFVPDFLKPRLKAPDICLSLYSNITKSGAHPIETYLPNENETARFKDCMELILPCIPKKYL